MSVLQEPRETEAAPAPIRVRSVVYLADRQGNLLLVRRVGTTGLWGLPGGLLHPGESLAEAAQRGVLAQLNLTLAGLQLVNVFSGKNVVDRGPSGETVACVCAAFLPDSAGGKIRLDPRELAEARFFATWNLPRNLFYSADAQAVAHFIERFPGGRPQTLEDMRISRLQKSWETPRRR